MCRCTRRRTFRPCWRTSRRRLEAMVSYAERVGAVPVLIVPAANDAGYAPNRSFLAASTPARRA